MPDRLPDHLKLALASIGAFADDGRLDHEELDQLMAVALRDDVVDDEEKRVLGNILARAEADGVDAATGARITEIRAKHGLG